MKCKNCGREIRKFTEADSIEGLGFVYREIVGDWTHSETVLFNCAANRTANEKSISIGGPYAEAIEES